MIPRLIEALVSMRAKPPVVKIYLVAITTAADNGQPPPPGLSLNAPELIPASGVFSDTPIPHVGVPPGVFASKQVSGKGKAMEPASTLAAGPQDPLSVALLVQQLPTLQNFNGHHVEGDGERRWLECVELIASACRWDD